MNICQYYLLRYLFSCLLILFGIIEIFGKVKEASNFSLTSDQKFSIIATILRFISYSFCLLAYPIRTECFTIRSTQLTHSDLDPLYRSWLTKLGIYNYIFISGLDFGASLALYHSVFSLSLISVMCIQMSPIIFVLLYRLVFGKLSLFRHQWLGLLLSISGICIIFLQFTIINLQSAFEYHYKTHMQGFLGSFFEALILIWQEFLMTRLKHSVEMSLGIRGILGLLWCGILVVSFDYYTIFPSLNSFSSTWTYYTILSAYYFFAKIKTLEITDALTVCTINLGSFALVILYFHQFLYLGFTPYGRKINETEIICGVAIFIGILIFNEILVIPCFGLNRSVRISRNKIKALLEIEMMLRVDSIHQINASI
jgi:drug/metabolite transporter (DMT)-like permease